MASHLITFLAASLALFSVISCLTQTDPIYDHQRFVYKPVFENAILAGDLTFTAFFAPEYSSSMYVEIINNATSSIDIATSVFSSWGNCSNQHITPEGTCIGCSVSEQNAETFPVFAALLNAVHDRGVKVRLLTNDYNLSTCAHMIAPLDWLQYSGITVRYYTATTYVHEKAMLVDGTRLLLSSLVLNEQSFMQNREAAVIVDGPRYNPLYAFAVSVFAADWASAVAAPLTLQQYTESEWQLIRSTHHRQVVIPPPPQFKGAFTAPMPRPVRDVTASVTVWASPDNARAQLLAALSAVQCSVELYELQVTDPDICSLLIELSARKSHPDCPYSSVLVRVLVSNVIDDPVDRAAAEVCYARLHAAGVSVRLSPSYYAHAHNKYAVLDSGTVLFTTGNLSPADYPPGTVFPPYPDPSWQAVNRDLSALIHSPVLSTYFLSVLCGDYVRGSDWQP